MRKKKSQIPVKEIERDWRNSELYIYKKEVEVVRVWAMHKKLKT